MAALLAGNPLLQREMAALRRTRWQQITLRLTWAAFALAFVVAAMVWSAIPLIAAALPVGLALVAILRAIAGGASCITREREQQTWEAIVLTRLRPHEIIIGKAVPVAAVALLPAVPAIPFSLILAWSTDMPLGPVLYCQAYVLLVALLCAALAMRVSATSRRTPDAVVRAGLLVVFIVAPAAGALLAGTGEDAATRGVLLLAVGILSVGVLAKAADQVRSGDEAVARWARGSGALLWLAVLLLLWTGAIRAPRSYRVSDFLLGVLILVCCLGVAAACAAAGPPPARQKPLPEALRAGGEGWPGALRHWALLHLLGLGVVGLATLLESQRYLHFRDGTLALAGEVFWRLSLATGAFLVCAGLGCVCAARLRTVGPACRALVALAGPLWLALATDACRDWETQGPMLSSYRLSGYLGYDSALLDHLGMLLSRYTVSGLGRAVVRDVLDGGPSGAERGVLLAVELLLAFILFRVACRHRVR